MVRHRGPSRAAAAGLRALYAYYERTEAMLSHVLRDAENMPALRQVGAPRRQWLEQVEQRLAHGWDGNAGQARHAIALAIDFRTWQTLVGKRRLNSDQAIALTLAMVDGAAHDRLAD